MQLIPSLDIQAGRSRLVFWPGAGAGSGAPTDRPEQIARHFVGLGAPLIHIVDLDGAVRGAPANIDAIQRISRTVAVPIQLAGGVDGAEQIELAFAAGATRVVVPLWSVVESVETLRGCLRVASDWLAVGMDARADRLRDYPWQSRPLAFDEIVAMLATEGVRRLVVSHWTPADLPRIAAAGAEHDVEIQLAGGAADMPAVLAASAAGVHGLILGEVLFTGAVDYATVGATVGAAASVAAASG